MKGQIDEVQKSQEKMWGGISQMGEELQGLVAKQNASDFEHEEEETAPEYSSVETSAPRKMASPIPLIGMPSPSVHVDTTSVRDSVSSGCQGSQHPHCLTLKLGSVMHNYLLGSQVLLPRASLLWIPWLDQRLHTWTSRPLGVEMTSPWWTSQ